MQTKIYTKIYQEIEIGKNSDKILSFAFAEVLKNLWENLSIKFYQFKVASSTSLTTK